MSEVRFPLVLLALAFGGCGAKLPSDVTCEQTRSASPTDLDAALAAAQPGDCVVAQEGSYSGAFTVPAGVTLVAEAGASVTFNGTRDDAPAVKLLGGAGSALVDVHVVGAAGVGIAVEGGPATLSRIAVSGAKAVGVVASCDPACTGAAQQVLIDAPALTGNADGLWARAAWVVVDGGSSSQASSSSLSGGLGVIASAGAHLELHGTTVGGNQEVGVLIDGAQGTSAQLSGVEVSDNQGRGVWAQGLLGTQSDPKLQIDGNSRIQRNHIIGVGARDSQGIIIINSLVADTVAETVPVDVGLQASVGDGVGLFAGSGQVRLEGSDLHGNARCQALVDDGDNGIIIINSQVAGGEYPVVVQNTAASVDVPSDEISAAPPQPVSAPSIATPK